MPLIGPPTCEDADVDYTFAQVGIEVDTVSWAMNCGNISAAVAPYAIDEQMVTAAEPSSTICIHQTNTGRMIVAEVPVREGHAVVAGEFTIDGVPGAGAKVTLDFSDSAGATTGALLPTGNPMDTLEVPELGAIEASIVDAANPIVFVRAAGLGITGVEDRSISSRTRRRSRALSGSAARGPLPRDGHDARAGSRRVPDGPRPGAGERAAGLD